MNVSPKRLFLVLAAPVVASGIFLAGLITGNLSFGPPPIGSVEVLVSAMEDRQVQELKNNASLAHIIDNVAVINNTTLSQAPELQNYLQSVYKMRGGHFGGVYETTINQAALWRIEKALNVHLKPGPAEKVGEAAAILKYNDVYYGFTIRVQSPL